MTSFNPKVPPVYSASDIAQENPRDGDLKGPQPANQKPAFSGLNRLKQPAELVGVNKHNMDHSKLPACRGLGTPK